MVGVAKGTVAQLVEQAERLGVVAQDDVGLGQHEQVVGVTTQLIVHARVTALDDIGRRHLADVPLVDADATCQLRTRSECNHGLVACTIGTCHYSTGIPTLVPILEGFVVVGRHHANATEHLTGSSLRSGTIRTTALRIRTLGLKRSHVAGLEIRFG